MSETTLAPLFQWLAEPMGEEVSAAVLRMRRAPDVRHIAVMPDMHLATEVCVGMVIGTSRLLYPQAVGGDIGCGMLAVAFDKPADVLSNGSIAGRVLARLTERVPSLRRHRRSAVAMPEAVRTASLSHPSLESVRRDEGLLQFATLGSGNHFIELQADDEGRLWLMLHSGSRAMGQAIRDHHQARAEAVGGGLKALDAETDPGRAYVNDVKWARRYAQANREAMAEIVTEVVGEVIGARLEWETRVSIDHNHVAAEEHKGRPLWVHRKGAMPAGEGQAGVLPGSMGTLSFHVEGRGHPDALCSSAHGAGRSLSRHAARQAIPERELHRQMTGVWFDYRQAHHLREEAPSAYKDVRAVLRAQRDLVRVVRTLRPVLNYKGR